MSASFIYTRQGYVNLDRVDIAVSRKDGRFELISGGQVIGDCRNFGENIVTMVPTAGDWELLVPIEENDGTRSIDSEPILAWGLTVCGSLVPITPTERSGIEGDFVVRKVGSDRVYDSDAVGGYANANEWLRSESGI